MELSCKEIVSELNKYIIGQDEAKRAVAVALRNRYRRSMIKDDIKSEITPKNIIMKGPTGVGKTEIARRLSKLVSAPFVKVEATKYTEVGYVGRDVESMIRDLVEESIILVKNERYNDVKEKAQEIVLDKLAVILNKELSKDSTSDIVVDNQTLKEQISEGKFDNKIIEIEVSEPPKQLNMLAAGGGMELNMQEIVDGMMGKQKRRLKKLNLIDAKRIMIQEECDKNLDMDSVNAEALRRAEQNGIIFIDEIDKIAGKGSQSGPDVSREGVQRDILPIVEGCTVSTKYGPIKTDYILFIAAGAFHVSKIEDLIPELQGRFPVLVELNSLKKKDFEDILKHTENSLIIQYTKMLEVDNIKLEFKNDAITEIARIAELENETSENIGARRLHNILEGVLEDISFNATGKHPLTDVVIDKDYVDSHLSKTLQEFNLKKYML